MLKTSFPALQFWQWRGQFNAIIWCCFVFFCGLKCGIIVQPAEFPLQLLLLSKAQLSLCCISGTRGNSSQGTHLKPQQTTQNPRPSLSLPGEGSSAVSGKWAPLGGGCFLCGALENLAKLWRDFGVSRCLGKSSCPFLASCLPFALAGFIPFLCHGSGCQQWGKEGAGEGSRSGASRRKDLLSVV